MKPSPAAAEAGRVVEQWSRAVPAAELSRVVLGGVAARGPRGNTVAGRGYGYAGHPVARGAVYRNGVYRGAAWGAAAAGAAAVGAGAYYGSGYYNNNCYRDSYGQLICPNQDQY